MMNQRDMRNLFGGNPAFRILGGSAKRRKRTLIGIVLGLLGGCIVAKLLSVAVVVAIAGFFFDYTLWSIFAKDIPWYADCIVGTVICPLTVSAGLLCWAARLCDVEVPFIEPAAPTAVERVVEGDDA